MIARPFHVMLHALPADPLKPFRTSIDGVDVDALVLAVGTVLPPLGVSFDTVQSRLMELPQIHFEPDGFFLWSGNVAGERWQVDGNLFDRGEQLDHVELRGDIPTEPFRQLLAIFNHNQVPLIVQLVRHGVYVHADWFADQL